MSTEIQTPNNAAPAETPPMLAPQSVVAQLRAIRQQIADVTPLTAQQRKALRTHAATPNGVLQASINAIGASDLVQQAVGQPADEVRQLAEEANHWTAVEDELRTMLEGIAGANLVRRQRVGLLALQAYGFSRQLARDPSYAGLLPHVKEIKRLKSLGRRKKAAPQVPQTPQTPAPALTEHVES
jgi:hypothetical protein